MTRDVRLTDSESELLLTALSEYIGSRAAAAADTDETYRRIAERQRQRAADLGLRVVAATDSTEHTTALARLAEAVRNARAYEYSSPADETPMVLVDLADAGESYLATLDSHGAPTTPSDSAQR